VEIEAFIPLENLTDPMVEATATWPTPGRHRLLLSVDGQRVWDATFEVHDGYLTW